MPDITMCSNEDCVKYKDCYRATATPLERWQSWDEFKPINNTEENFLCDLYLRTSK